MNALVSALSTAVQRRLKENGKDPETGDTKVLLGECQWNAAAVIEELAKRDVDAAVVAVLHDRDFPTGEKPDTTKEAVETGWVHWLVRAENQYLEPASETELRYGEPALYSVDSRLADSFTSYEDSFRYFRIDIEEYGFSTKGRA